MNRREAFARLFALASTANLRGRWIERVERNARFVVRFARPLEIVSPLDVRERRAAFGVERERQLFACTFERVARRLPFIGLLHFVSA